MDELRLRQRLLWRIRRRYEIVTEPIELGHLRLLFTRVADPDLVLDQVAAEETRRARLGLPPLPDEQLHLPYWAQLWDSSAGLASFLARSQAASLLSVRDKSVLDLGCGMGLAGTAAAALGATVTFADMETPALLFAALNSLPWRRRVHLRRLNWRSESLNRRFQMILGADILYEKAQWPHLDAFWVRHLDAAGIVVLAEPGRQSGEGFLHWLDRSRWRVSEHSLPGRASPLRIFMLRMCQG